MSESAPPPSLLKSSLQAAATAAPGGSSEPLGERTQMVPIDTPPPSASSPSLETRLHTLLGQAGVPTLDELLQFLMRELAETSAPVEHAASGEGDGGRHVFLDAGEAFIELLNDTHQTCLLILFIEFFCKTI